MPSLNIFPPYSSMHYLTFTFGSGHLTQWHQLKTQCIGSSWGPEPLPEGLTRLYHKQLIVSN